MANGLFPAPEHQQLLQALSQVTIEDGRTLDRQLLDSEELRGASEEYRELNDEYRAIRDEIDRLVSAGESVPTGLFEIENDLADQLRTIGASLLDPR